MELSKRTVFDLEDIAMSSGGSTINGPKPICVKVAVL